MASYGYLPLSDNAAYNLNVVARHMSTAPPPLFDFLAYGHVWGVCVLVLHCHLRVIWTQFLLSAIRRHRITCTAIVDSRAERPV